MSEPVSHEDVSGQPDSVDWAAVRDSAEYQRLRAAQRRFLIPTSVIYLVVYFGFLVVALNAPALFGHALHGGLNVGFVVMTALFVLVWLGVLLHNAVARRRWDPRIARLRAEVSGGDPASTSDRS
jgi:uncharacterized membrane protein (DUF485 family)